MKKTKTFAPYTGNKCTLTKTGPGVYIIYKKGKPAYVGFSASNVKKTMYRHFQSWDDPTQKRVVYKHLVDITCRVIFTTATRAPKLEEALILSLKPVDNTLKLEMYSNTQRAEVLEDLRICEVVPF
jgi:hypothetical protein